MGGEGRREGKGEEASEKEGRDRGTGDVSNLHPIEEPRGTKGEGKSIHNTTSYEHDHD